MRAEAGAHTMQTKGTVTVHVPIKFTRRGGRKLVIAPVHQPPATVHRTGGDDALVKMLARAYRWHRLLGSGAYDSIQALAAAEKIDKSYMSKILRLTILAPAIVEMILDGTQPRSMDRKQLLRPFPSEWQRQRIALSETRSVD